MNQLTKLFSTLVTGDQFAKAFFIHGSYVTKEASNDNYKEYRFYKSSEFLFSYFELQDMNPDIDLIYVSTNLKESELLIKKFFQSNNIGGHFITINLVLDSVFYNEVTSTSPTAMKRILQFRPLEIIQGDDFLSEMRQLALSKKTQVDTALQDSYEMRKKYLRTSAQQKKKCVLLDLKEYRERFSMFCSFMLGEIDGGFPKNRVKLVFPKEMDLKAIVKLDECILEHLT